ncbi:MAG: LuxR C-terminal-related transcriptional regulator [Cystobacter sp.]
MGLVKGSLLLHTKQFIHDRFGPEAWRAQLTELSAAERAGMLQPMAAYWYDLNTFRHLLRAMSQYFGKGSRAVMAELGRFTADRELSGARSWLLHPVQSSLTVRSLEVGWRRLFDMGCWTFRHEEGALVLQLSEWEEKPALCEWGTGYVHRVLELCGWQVKGIHLMDEGAADEDACAFHVEGSLELNAVRVRKLTSRAEVLQVAQALARYDRAEEMARLIVELVRVQLGGVGVLLWVASNEESGMRLLCTTGEREPGEQGGCFLLEAGGRTVGRIEVRQGRKPLEETSADLLDELMPFIADRLAHLLDLRAPPPEPLPNEDEAFHQRLRMARHLWGLTSRQSDVLALAVRGQANKEISMALGCQKSTVELHISHILRKCRADNRTVLTAKFWLLH